MQFFDLMTLVVGPPGPGKTAWISQFLKDASHPLCYLYPGMQESVISDEQASSLLADLPDQAQIFMELGVHLALESPFLAALPGRRMAIGPPMLLGPSEWRDWADEVIFGKKNDQVVSQLHR